MNATSSTAENGTTRLNPDCYYNNQDGHKCNFERNLDHKCYHDCSPIYDYDGQTDECNFNRECKLDRECHLVYHCNPDNECNNDREYNLLYHCELDYDCSPNHECNLECYYNDQVGHKCNFECNLDHKCYHDYIRVYDYVSNL